MTNIEELPYRPAVGIMLLNQDNMVFVGKRIDTKSEAWQMPQGGIDAGEEARVAVLRELQEEVGSGNAEIIAESKGHYYYDLPHDLVAIAWGGKYKGQQQKWFALRFLGADSDINIHTEHAEFCEWKWVEMASLPDIIVPFKRDLYTNLIEEFKDIRW